MKRTLPYHHIDANVIIGVFVTIDSKTREKCVNYIDKIGYKYKGGVSPTTLGEVCKIFGKIKDKQAREEAFLFLGDLLYKKKLKVCKLNPKDVATFNEFREYNHFSHVPDLLSLAIAVREKALVFMTFDEDILENEVLRSHLKREYKVKIQSPV